MKEHNNIKYCIMQSLIVFSQFNEAFGLHVPNVIVVNF